MTDSTAVEVRPTLRDRVRRRLSPPNPFYLLSAAFILHSTGLGLQGQGELPPLVLTGLVGGYVLLMAAIAFAIVRLWKVWDDARSILLVVMLLFLELALAADRPLMEDRATGIVMLFGGLAIAIAVTEIILRGLRMRLPSMYRGPLYGLWGLLFVYPLVLVGPIDAKEYGRLPWLLLLFPVLVGAGLMALLPAVRRGRSALTENGTPWKWPLYPWTIFVFLGLCLLLRSYALCLSFDPALVLTFEQAWSMQSIYGPYFAVPMLFALAWLVMEAGIVRQGRIVQIVGLLIPVVCIVLAFPGRGGNAAYARFVEELVSTVGSPAWVMLIGAGLFYLTAACRGVGIAWRGALLCLLALSIVSPTTVELRLPTTVTTWSLFAGAAIAGAVGVWQSRSWLVWEGAVYAVLAMAAEGDLAGDVLSPPRTVYYVLSFSALLIGGLVRDRAAQRLRRLGATAVMLAAADMCLQSTRLHAIPWLPVTFLGLCCLLPLVVGYWRDDRFVRATAVAGALQWYTGGLLQLFVLLTGRYTWSGWTSFAAGIVLLHVGVMLSGVKGGAHRLILLRLLGPPSEPTTS